MTRSELTSGLQQRELVAAFLREAREEIEEVTLARLQSLDPGATVDPVYHDGLRAAVEAGTEYAIEFFSDRDTAIAIPPLLISRARQAARRAIPLDELVRRYLSAFSLLTDFVYRANLRSATLKALVKTMMRQLDEVIGLIASEYSAELRRAGLGRDEEMMDRIHAILAGDLVDLDALNYRLAPWHVGGVAIGPAAAVFIREAASSLGLQALFVQAAVDIVWMWCGADCTTELEELLCVVGRPSAPSDIVLGLGEPASGIGGFRRTHSEASAAVRVSYRERVPKRYGDVALLASLIQDDLLSSSLRKRYLKPLEADQEDLRTLSAYFSAGQNISAAAAALGRSRRTVNNRIATLEKRLGRSLTAGTHEVEAALLLWELPEYDVEEGHLAAPS